MDQKGGKYTLLSANQIRADVAYKDGVAEGILQSVTSTVSANGTVTNMGESLNKVTAGSFAGVSHSGGTEVAGSWNYIIQDSSWEDSVEAENHKDGYVDLIGNKMPKGFITAESNKGLVWDNNKQAYTYKGKAVDYSNVYVIEGKIGVFTNKEGTKVYTGTVYGKNNEILMTVKDKDNNFYSYWAAEATDPSATMATYRVEEYKKNLAVLEENDNKLSRDDIKKVTLDTSKANSAIIGLLRNGGNAVDGAITVTSGGGTGGSGAAHDTFVTISNAADTEGKTFATGSKVEAIVDNNGATTGIKINGEDYTIKSGSKVSVTQTADKKTTTITVDGQATTITDTDTHNELKSASLSGKTLTITGKDNDSVNVDLSSIDTDTKYTAGNGIAIDENNGHAISVKLKEGENNLEVTEAGLELKKDLTVNRVEAGDFYMSTAGIGYGDKAYITSSGLNANSQKITGVADGTIAEGSKDAVNGSQLNATNKKVDELNAEAGKHTTLVAGDNVTLVAKKTDNGLEYTVTAKDTTYSAGDNVAIDKDNKISVDLSQYAKTEDVAVVYVDNNKNKSLHTTNSGAVESNAIALGKGASAHENSVVIGDGAYTQKGNFLTGSGYSVALGNNAVTGTKSTSVGYKAIGGRVGTITVGYNSYNGAAYGTVIGTESKINYSAQKTANAAATIVGAQSEIIADNKPYSGVANGIFGSANKIQNSNGVTIQGSGNTVTNAYKDMSGSGFNLGGVSVKKDAGAVGVIGGMNTVSNQIYTNVIGFGNTVAGDADNISHDVFLAGSRNNLSNVSDSIVMGNENAITGVSNVISFGHDNKIKASNAVAIGNGAGVSVEGGVALGVGSVASTDAGALGYGAVSVGSSVEGKKITRQITNVAAGTEDTDAVNVAQLKKVSEAAASASQGWKLKTQNGNASDVKPGATVEFDGDANIQVGNDGNKVSVTLKNQLTGIQSITGVGEGAGSISFANDGIKFNNKVTIDNTGKISGVADGKISADSKEAVNGSQLNAVKETANKGWNLSTNGDEASTKVAPGETVDFSGDKNISVSHDGTNVKVELNDELKDIKSISNGNKTISLDGTALLLKNGDATLAIAKGAAGMQNGAGASVVLNGTQTVINGGVTFDHTGKITNVKAGEADTDAVNVGQLKDYVAANDTHIKSGDYVVGEVTDSTGNKSQGVSMDIVNKEGNVTGTVTITDVAKASDVGNVNDIADDLKNGGEGKTTVVEAVNNLNNKLDTKVGDLQYSKVEKGDIADGDSTTTAIGKLDQKLTDVAATAAKHTKVEGSKNITVNNTAKEGEAANYKVELNNDIDVNTVKANSVTTGQTVMDKDGLKVGDKVSVTATAVKVGDTTITDKGLEIKDGPSVTKDGINAGNKKVTGVADGDVKENSKDAINGGQLHQVKADINNRINGVENQVISNSNRINQLGNRVNKVGAGAAALAALHPMDFDPDDKLTFSAGYGNYGGENAAAIGAYYRPDEKVMFSVGGTVGNGENMVNAGVSFALDRTNHVSNSRTALAREVIDLRGQLAVMGAKMAKMEKALGMLDETKTKLFPDIPANHWAYEYIAKLAGNGYIEGYPDGNFGGDRLMTRYEFAAMLYRAIENGAALEEKIIKEFEPELGRIRVDRISGEDGDRDKIERVRVNDTKGERDHYGNKLAK